MALRVEQAAIVVLAVDLDRERADVAKQPGGHRRAADESAAAAVALQRAADDQRLAGLDCDPLLAEQRRWPDDRTASSISADTAAPSSPERTSAGVGARAEREAERVEQDRLARAGLAGEHAEPRLELQLEPLDEHDVMDGELPQHARRIGAAACFAYSLRSFSRPVARCHMPVFFRSWISRRSDWRYQIGLGIVLAEHRRDPARLVRQAEREIGFDQPLERFGRVAGRRIFVDDGAEAIGRRRASCPSAGRSGRPPSPCRRDGR